MKFSAIWKTNTIFFLVLLYRVNLLYWKEVLISCQLPSLRDFRPKNLRYPQRFLEMYAILPCQGCAQEHSVCGSLFLFGNIYANQLVGGKKMHLLIFLNCGNSCCVFLQCLFGTVMANWIWCCYYFQVEKSSFASISLLVYFTEEQFKQDTTLKSNQLFQWALPQRTEYTSALSALRSQLCTSTRQTGIFLLSQRTSIALLGKL